MNSVRTLALLALVLLLGACVARPRAVARAAQLRLGMSEAQVVAVMGSPIGRAASGATTRLDLPGCYFAMFERGKLIAYGPDRKRQRLAAMHAAQVSEGMHRAGEIMAGRNRYPRTHYVTPMGSGYMINSY